MCETGSYAKPEVAIRRDSDRAADLVRSLFQRNPRGPTPTAPALAGGLQYARQWALAHPARQVVTLLVTDGFPTECEPQDVPAIADLARAGSSASRGVRTFVIGVFSDSDLDGQGRQALDEIAEAGGTQRAFVVGADSRKLTEELLVALDQIRRTAVSCDFQLDSGFGLELDLERVNLQITSDDEVVTALQRVVDTEDCSGQAGWFYERDTNGKPTHIRVCPLTCSELIAGGVRADLQIGCATRLR